MSTSQTGLRPRDSNAAAAADATGGPTALKDDSNTNAAFPVPVVKASQVKHLVLKHCNDRIHPPTFVLEPEKRDFVAAAPKPPSMQLGEDDREHFKMKATQLPVLSNSATTGHKLQGSGAEHLFVHSWRHVTNWPCVMLSRVKARWGLYLRNPLSDDLKKYAVPQSLSQLIGRFKKRQPQEWTDIDYDRLFRDA